MDADTVLGCDFFNFWAYGQSAFSSDPGAFYNWPAYSQYQTALGVDHIGHNWSYPPNILLLTAPFGLLSYGTSLVVWTVSTIMLFLAVLHKKLSIPSLIALVLFSPAALNTLISGQSSLLTTTIILGAWCLLDCRPILAGVLIGLLSFKPQVALMFPVILIAMRRWPTFAAAAATTLAIGAATTILFGPNVWLQYVQFGLPYQNAVLTDPDMLSAPYMPTLLMSFREFGWSYSHAMAAQALFSLGAIAIVFWAFRFYAEANKNLLFLLFAACTVCASPYLLIYDLMPLTLAVVMSLARRDSRLPQLLLFGVFFLPTLNQTFGALHIGGAALIIPVLITHLVLELVKSKPRDNASRPFDLLPVGAK